MSRATRKILIAGFLLAAAATNGRAADAPVGAPAEEKSPGGIRTDFGDVTIKNLGIGRTYNLRDLAGVPMKVTNSGMETVNLVMSVEIPKPEMITPRRQELGYKAIPALDWVTLNQTQFLVPAGESAYTDVIIKIPDDPTLYGKKFQASIYSRTTGGGFLNLGVFSHLEMEIADSPEVQAAVEKNRKRGVVANMDYTLLPDKIFIQDAPLGKDLDVKATAKKTIMIANSGADPIKLRVEPVAIGDTPLSLQTGFEIGDPRWLSVAAQEVTVDGSSFTDPGLVLKLPNDKSLAGKQLMFAVKVEPADASVVGVTFYGKLYVEVQK